MGQTTISQLFGAITLKLLVKIVFFMYGISCNSYGLVLCGFTQNLLEVLRQIPQARNVWCLESLINIHRQVQYVMYMLIVEHKPVQFKYTLYTVQVVYTVHHYRHTIWACVIPSRECETFNITTLQFSIFGSIQQHNCTTLLLLFSPQNQPC